MESKYNLKLNAKQIKCTISKVPNTTSRLPKDVQTFYILNQNFWAKELTSAILKKN